MEEGFVAPGERVSTVEEYVNGEGTYEKDGVIYASRAGSVRIDNNEREIAVKPSRSGPRYLEPDDVVIGMARAVKRSMVSVNILKCVNDGSTILSGDIGTLHISKIDRNYHQDFSDIVGVGDVIKARVIAGRPSIQLTLDGPDLGVLRGQCITCGFPFVLAEGRLYCDHCRKVVLRKYAEGYVVSEHPDDRIDRSEYTPARIPRGPDHRQDRGGRRNDGNRGRGGGGRNDRRDRSRR